MGIFDGLIGMISGGANTTLPINQNTMPQMSPDQWSNNIANTQTGGLFGDPNFINFLAGTGAALDPDGVGGAVGKATQGMVQNQQMGKAMEKQDKRWSAFIEAMGKGQVGSVSIKEDPKGGTSISMKAPEGGLGSLDQPVQSNVPMQPVSPFQQYMNDMDGWMKKYGGM